MTDYTKLVEALRSASTVSTAWEKLMHDAAAAIKALQAEVESMNESCKKQLVAMASHVAELQAEVKRLEPKQRKLGRWEKAKPKGVVTYSDGYAECSHCHETIWLGWGMNFCPHCGTQNKIIDPDDYDGAKMEVQIIKSVTMREDDTDTDGFFRKAVEAVTEVQE